MSSRMSVIMNRHWLTTLALAGALTGCVSPPSEVSTARDMAADMQEADMTASGDDMADMMSPARDMSGEVDVDDPDMALLDMSAGDDMPPPPDMEVDMPPELSVKLSVANRDERFLLPGEGAGGERVGGSALPAPLALGPNLQLSVLRCEDDVCSPCEDGASIDLSGLGEAQTYHAITGAEPGTYGAFRLLTHDAGGSIDLKCGELSDTVFVEAAPPNIRDNPPALWLSAEDASKFELEDRDVVAWSPLAYDASNFDPAGSNISLRYVDREDTFPNAKEPPRRVETDSDFGGRAVVSFDGDGALVFHQLGGTWTADTSLSLDKTFTLFAVLEHGGYSINSTSQSLLGCQRCDSPWENSLRYWNDETFSEELFELQSENVQSVGNYVGHYEVGDRAIPHVLAVHFDAQSKQVFVWFNGELLAAQEDEGSLDHVVSWAFDTLGGIPGGGSRERQMMFRGKIAEVIVFDQVSLPRLDGVVEDMIEYLGIKYGIATNFSAPPQF